MAIIIDESTKQRIIDTAEILDVVSDFVSLKKRGASYVGLCPFHNDRNPSFYVTPSRNYCKCFSCGEGGGPVSFIMKHEHMSYPESLKYLANKYGIHVEEREESDEERRQANERESLFVINDFASKYFHRILLETEEGQNIGLSYFSERSVRRDSIEKFGLGYALEERTAFTKEALAKSFEEKYLLSSGLSSKYDEDRPPFDRFSGRVIFPIYTISGKIVGFGGRILRKSDKLAKYINSPESIIYSKSRELYGLYQAKRSISREDKCYLVEGYLDVIQMHQSGIENVVASSGTALTEGQIRLIQRFSRNVTLVYDGDPAGIKAALRGVDMLLGAGMQIKVVLLPSGEDPDSMAQKLSAQDFIAYLIENEQDFISFKTNLLLDETIDDPITRARVIGEIVDSISLIPDTIGRSVYIQSTAQLLSMDEGLLKTEVLKRRNYRTSQTQQRLSHQQRAAIQTQQTTNTEGTTIKQAKEETTAGTIIPSSDLSSLPSYETELLRILIRHGNELVQLEGENEGETISYPLGFLIQDEIMNEDELVAFLSPTFQLILSELGHGIEQDNNFQPDRYFINHPNEVLAQLAVNLTHEKYTPSRLLDPPIEEMREEDQEIILARQQHSLFERSIRGIYDVRNAYTLERIKEIHKSIARAQHEGNKKEMLELMGELGKMTELRRMLAKELGERTIILP